MPEDKSKIKIELTQEQYLALLKAVYLGNWMANANRDGSPEDPHIEEYEAVSDYMFSLAPLFGFKKYVDHRKDDGKHFYPTNDFEEQTDVHTLHREYDEDAFWDELCDMLGERDFHRLYSPNEIIKMGNEERFTKLQECIIRYELEFEEKGVEQLEIMKTLGDLIK